MGFIIDDSPLVRIPYNISSDTDGRITALAGFTLLYIVVKLNTSGTIDVGYTNGGTEIEDNMPLVAGKSHTITINQTFDQNTFIYITGAYSKGSCLMVMVKS